MRKRTMIGLTGGLLLTALLGGDAAANKVSELLQVWQGFNTSENRQLAGAQTIATSPASGDATIAPRVKGYRVRSKLPSIPHARGETCRGPAELGITPSGLGVIWHEGFRSERVDWHNRPVPGSKMDTVGVSKLKPLAPRWLPGPARRLVENVRARLILGSLVRQGRAPSPGQVGKALAARAAGARTTKP